MDNVSNLNLTKVLTGHVCFYRFLQSKNYINFRLRVEIGQYVSIR